MNVQTALTELYLTNPCQVLPNALWKTLDRLPEMTVSQVYSDRALVSLDLRTRRELLCFWTMDRSAPDRFPNLTIDLDLALVHADHFRPGDAAGFSDVHRFFRLQLDPGAPLKPVGSWNVRPADPVSEAGRIAAFLRRCYAGSAIESGTVLSWTKRPVFDPRLWIWLLGPHGDPAGLGIAEFDPEIREGSLEWIQTAPEFRRQGVGRRTVLALLERLEGRAAFVTVSGRLGLADRPDLLYRSCGFTGDDIWWVLRK